MSICIDVLKEGTVLCGTDILATEIAKNSQAAAAVQKDADRINKVDAAINAIYQFVTDCGYHAIFDRSVWVNDDMTLSRYVVLRMYDSDSMESYGFNLIFAIFENAYNGINVTIRDMYDHILEVKNNSRGYSTTSRKHPLSFLAKFGAKKVCASEYCWAVDDFIKAIPAMTKHFKKSNTLGKYRTPNEEIVRNCLKSQRKMDIQKTKINAFVNEFETFLESIAPGTHVFCKETASDPKTATWAVSVYNTKLPLWSDRYQWHDNLNRAQLQEIFSEEGIYSDSVCYQIDNTNIAEQKAKLQGWIDDCTDDAARAEYTKILNEEANRPLAYIDGIFNTNAKYINNFTYDGEYSALTRAHQVNILFNVSYSTESDSWNIIYRGLRSFPAPFKKFMDNADRISKNPADLIKYVELVYKTSLKANDYANKVIELTKAAEEDLKA